MFNKTILAFGISLLFSGEALLGMKPAVDNQKKNAEVVLGVESAWISLPAVQEDDARTRIALTEKLNTMAEIDEPGSGYELHREKSCVELCQETMTAVYGAYLISQDTLPKESIDQLFDDCACPIFMQRWAEDKTFWPELRKAWLAKCAAENVRR